MLGKPDISKPAEAFSEGDQIPLRVIEFDSKNRKILLSVDAYYAVREREELDNFLAAHPTRTIKVEEMVDDVGGIKEEVETKAAETAVAEEEAEAEPDTGTEAENESEMQPAEVDRETDTESDNGQK
jgi:hypothetical protein